MNVPAFRQARFQTDEETKMQAAVKAITSFQNVAILTAVGAAGYYCLYEPQQSVQSRGGDEQQAKKGHTLSGELVDRENQVCGSERTRHF